ncbi:hypothetical protein LIER_36454 [Lithospermum erythrorhizon]|uniref:Serine protease n=1 Tax=Lithospermum erythrorhizon TaxID=34254 RepID=A0AAV3PAV7_LITER
MEQVFPKGKLEKPLSDKRRVQFCNKMKPVVWAIKVDTENDETRVCTGFCIRKDGLLLTVSHVFSFQSNDVAPIKLLSICARRDLDKDEEFFACTIVHIWDHFDLVLLKVDDDSRTLDANFKGFDYATIEHVSRKLPSGIELFSIGLYQGHGFHLFTGVLINNINPDDIDYAFLGLDNKFKVERVDLENSSVYNDKMPTFGFPKDLHPGLKFLEASFMGDLSGMSGSPIFSSEGKIVSIVQRGLCSTFGVTHRALIAFVQSYGDS